MLVTQHSMILLILNFKFNNEDSIWEQYRSIKVAYYLVRHCINCAEMFPFSLQIFPLLLCYSYLIFIRYIYSQS